ncbi:amino acid ABC transporter permease [Rhizobium sp. ZPR3]|uniref:Amino acid ABC transporter permease n=2 Tax=unclassified Rhizobium TaxID=2613769 RepID=A0AAU7SLA3_9HYPH
MRSFTFSDFLFFLTALEWTFLMAAMALAFGAPLAVLLAIARSGKPILPRYAASAFIDLVQGIPLLGLLMFFYFGVPVLLGTDVPALAAVGAAYTIYTAAFLGDVWRGGIQAVKQAQWEAGACLGLSWRQQFVHIIGPQAFRVALPATVGFLVQLIKNTSLASVVGIVELARAGQVVSAGTFQPLFVYLLIAGIYFAICFPLTTWSRKLEARLNGAR